MKSPTKQDLKSVGEFGEVDLVAEMCGGAGKRASGAPVGGVADLNRNEFASADEFAHARSDGDERRERREIEPLGAAMSMVDALEDILKWERASERAVRVARDQGAADLQSSTALKGVEAFN